MPELSACTIASNNYLAFARVFAESYKAHHPGAEVYVCIADRRHRDIAYHRFPFVPIFAEDLGIPLFHNFAFRYDIVEFNTAVKPYLLALLRDRHNLERVLYFDPDILVFDRLHALAQSLDSHSVVLTPHITRPLDDGKYPSERAIRMAGVYNLGFLGLRLDESSRAFLKWWQDRLHAKCVSDPPRGLFVDQSWMDFAPAFLESVRILRDSAYNVAYWNLPHHRLARENGQWRVNGHRLGFFHFSGIDLDDLERISRYQDRLTLRDRPELRPLFEDYRARLLAAGHQRFARVPYGFGAYGRGEIPIPPAHRRLLQRLDPRARRWPDPFEILTPDSFLAYLVERLAFAGGSLNRAALTLWEERPDLQRAFADVCGADLPRYVEWLTQDAAHAGLHEVFLAGLDGSANGGRRKRPTFSYQLHPYDAASIDVACALAQNLDYSNPGRLTPWLNEPVPGTARRRPIITRLALLIHRLRADLQATFPDPLGADQPRFAYWFVSHGAAELKLHRALVAPVERSLGAKRQISAKLRNLRLRRRATSAELSRPGAAPRRPVWTEPPVAGPAAVGVNVAGYLDMDTGVGHVARGVLSALHRAGIAVAPIHLDRRTFDGIPEAPSGSPYPLTILHANADETPRVLQLLPRAIAAGNYTVACWFWELAHFPLQFAASFDYVDEIWAPSRFCAQSIAAIAPVPVHWVPPCVLPPRPGQAGRRELGLDAQRFYFYSSFDVASVPERKNPRGTIEAFSRLARVTGRAVGLVMRVNRAEQAPGVMGELRAAAGDLPVRILAAPASREEVDTLLAACDACLSLHRSEGLGLVPIEGLYLQKPVIATGYGGVTDYLDQSNSFPVSYALRRLESGFPPYPAGAVWAEPDLDEAVAAMLDVVERPEEARRRALAGRQRVESLYGLEPAGKRYREQVERIWQSLETSRGSSRSAPSSPGGAATEPRARERLSVRPW